MCTYLLGVLNKLRLVDTVKHSSLGANWKNKNTLVNDVSFTTIVEFNFFANSVEHNSQSIEESVLFFPSTICNSVELSFHSISGFHYNSIALH